MELELRDLLTAEFAEDGDGEGFYNCWNLIREVYRRAGRVLPEYSEYIAAIADRSNLIETIKDDDFVPLSRPEFLAIVLFTVRGAYTHMGVVIDRNRYIHMRKKAGVAIERLDIGEWSKRIEGFYSYAGSCKVT